MKVKGLDGKIYNLDLTGHQPLESAGRPRSQYHLKARELLRELYPLDQRLEEVVIPATHGLSLDFYIPSRNIAFEVHGPQHYTHIEFFHKSNQDYWKALRRDIEKREWCEINNITLIELPFNEDEDGWKRRIFNNGKAS